MKYIDAEKLKSEIQSLIDLEYDKLQGNLYHVISLIDSLQQEQQEVDLEEEMRKELRLHYNDDQDVYWWNYLKNSFRHFYELGLKANDN